MGIPTDPEPGDKHIDASAVPLRDLTPEYIRTLTKLRGGYLKAVACVERLTPEQLKANGINPQEVAALVAQTAEHKQLSSFHEASAKLTELFHDSKMEKGHQIATRLAEMAEQARRRADRSQNSAEILGPLAELLEYQFSPAEKALSTKTKAKGAPIVKGSGTKPASGEPVA
jgi:hypothetical protein